MMTVGQLKAVLSEWDDADLVVLSKDGEGNTFSPLSSWGEGVYEAETTWAGAVYQRVLTPDLVEQGFTEDDVREPSDDTPLCIVLWPVN
jgi:hypothetical protein